MQAISERIAKSPAVQFVVSRGWDFREASNDQIAIAECPFCHKGDYKFMMAVMNPEIGTRDGLYMCFHGSCGKTGNIRILKEHLGILIPNVESRSEWAGRTGKVDQLPDVETCHAALLSDAEATDYLINVRGFSMEAIKKQRLGLKEKVYFREAGETRALVIPYLSIEGNITFAKFRTLPPAEKAFACPSGHEAGLYNSRILTNECKEIIMTEGELDAISLISRGIEYVVGVPGANVKKLEWIELLDQLNPKIYILYDSDRAGQKGAQELASRIGIERCLKIVLPKGIKDINDYFTKGGTLEGFERLKEEAKLFDISGVSSTTDSITLLEDELAGKKDMAPKYVTGWPSLNRLFGMEDGDVLDIMADAKQGKTTIALNILDHMCASYGEDGILICLEMDRIRLAKKWISLVTGWEDKITTPGSEEAKQQLEKLKEACIIARQVQQNREADLYFSYPQGYTTPEDIYSLMKNVIRRYGCKWICLDNLQLLADNTLGNKQAFRTIHLSQISKALARIAKDYRIKLIRILQPRQIEGDQLIQARHTDGSSQISKDCDALITLWRSQMGTLRKSEWEKGNGDEDTEASFDPKCRITVALSRYSSGGSCTLFFDGAKSQVREMDTKQKTAMAQAKTEYNQLIPMEKPVLQEEKVVI